MTQYPSSFFHQREREKNQLLLRKRETRSRYMWNVSLTQKFWDLVLAKHNLAWKRQFDKQMNNWSKSLLILTRGVSCLSCISQTCLLTFLELRASASYHRWATWTGGGWVEEGGGATTLANPWPWWSTFPLHVGRRQDDERARNVWLPHLHFDAQHSRRRTGLEVLIATLMNIPMNYLPLCFISNKFVITVVKKRLIVARCYWINLINECLLFEHKLHRISRNKLQQHWCLLQSTYCSINQKNSSEQISTAQSTADWLVKMAFNSSWGSVWTFSKLRASRFLHIASRKRKLCLYF